MKRVGTSKEETAHALREAKRGVADAEMYLRYVQRLYLRAHGWSSVGIGRWVKREDGMSHNSYTLQQAVLLQQMENDNERKNATRS